MYKTPNFYDPQLLYQMVKVHFCFITGKVLLITSYHKIMTALPWMVRIYEYMYLSIFNLDIVVILNDAIILHNKFGFVKFILICCLMVDIVLAFKWITPSLRFSRGVIVNSKWTITALCDLVVIL